MVPDVHDITFYVFTLYPSLCFQYYVHKHERKFAKNILKKRQIIHIESKEETENKNKKIVLVWWKMFKPRAVYTSF